MAPEEICRRLGEAKVKELFASMTADAMKKILQEAGLPTKRGANQITTAQRNAAYADRFWRHVADGKGNARACATVMYEWFVRHRRPLLAAFLDGIGVSHDSGLTDANFMTDTAPEALQAAGRKLLEKFERQEVAAYLLFLDVTSEKQVFAGMGLEDLLSARGAAREAAAPTP